LDFIDAMMEYTEGFPTPEIFRLWTAIGTVSALLERRCWTVILKKPIYPNLYIMLVAPPAVGKSAALDAASTIWNAVDNLKVAPKDITHASLLDALNDVPKQMILGSNKMVDYHSMAINCSEFASLLPAYTAEMMTVLNDIFDCPARYDQARRTGNRKLNIPNPSMTIIAGAQPGYLATTFPEEAWSMGFASRMMMIYAAVGVKPRLFEAIETNVTLEDHLVDMANEIFTLKGEVFWDLDVKEEMIRWAALDLAPEPKHNKLTHYRGRRLLNFSKLLMISSAARGKGDLQITMADFRRAQTWMLEAEAKMPDIFRDMVHKSDNDVLAELHLFMMRKYMRSNKQPVPESDVINFLQTKVPADKMRGIIYAMERGGMVDKMEIPGNNLYIPKPNADHHMETNG
jgi:hypothetical protein